MNDAKKSLGKVYLIGAGPGDPKLLTIKAAEAIGASDVIVYDYLVNPEVLAHSRRDAELIYAGKRAGEPSISQAQINHLLIERAATGQVVARLKGGDPFVFGRGGEEAEALVDAGINWEIIPGVSSGVAAAAYAGIPLTHRDHSSSVTFITGHDARGSNKQAVDWPILAHSADTLVIFMCAETISSITRELVAAGRAPSTPIAIVRWGTYQHQEVYSGTLDELIAADEYGGLRIEPPAIAIVGEVAALGTKLKWFGDVQLRFELRALLEAAVCAVGD
ncbi:MAG TPA: uroporphyrinogen-III C-methyltransferase [Blastocatellia bacterium]|nr:uroporphyrinogen-III C-methyltransferase [Blastocatellia bacterium]